MEAFVNIFTEEWRSMADAATSVVANKTYARKLVENLMTMLLVW